MVPLKHFIMLYYRLSSWINIVHICSNCTCIRNLILTMCVYCWSVLYMWHLLHVCELRTPSGLEAVLSPIQWEKQKNNTFQSNNQFSSLFHCFFCLWHLLAGIMMNVSQCWQDSAFGTVSSCREVCGDTF